MPNGHWINSKSWFYKAKYTDSISINIYQSLKQNESTHSSGIVEIIYEVTKMAKETKRLAQCLDGYFNQSHQELLTCPIKS